MPLEAKITGVEEVNRMLTDFPKQVVGQSFVKGLEAAAKPMLETLREKTPVRIVVRWNDEAFTEFNDEIGGALRDEIRSDIVIDSQLRGGYVDIWHGKLSYIANFLEYGHRIVTHDDPLNRALRAAERLKPKNERLKIARLKGQEVGFVEADPFMRETADVATNASVDAFCDAVISTLRAARMIE